jgi:hypothetical protein
MEKHDIPLLHSQIYLLSIEVLILLNSEIGLVHHSVPVWVLMVEKLAFVGLWHYVQGPVFLVGILQGCPGGHNPISRAKGEIRKVLVHGMTRTSSHSWGFVDEHGMHGFDILPAETFQVGDEFGVGAVTLEDLVELEILQLCY